MSKPNASTALVLCICAMFATGCGGGSDHAVSPEEAARLLLDQGAECFAVAAGRTSPARFDAAAAVIASVGIEAVCGAWPAGLGIDCRQAYALRARPYSHASQCA